MTDKPQEHRQPRELYLYRDKMLGSLHFSPDPVKDADRYEFFNHLIEKSAFSQLQSQYAQLAKEFNELRDRYENLRKAMSERT